MATDTTILRSRGLQSKRLREPPPKALDATLRRPVRHNDQPTILASNQGEFIGVSRSIQASASADKSRTESMMCGSVFAIRRLTHLAPERDAPPRTMNPVSESATAL